MKKLDLRTNDVREHLSCLGFSGILLTGAYLAPMGPYRGPVMFLISCFIVLVLNSLIRTWRYQ